MYGGLMVNLGKAQTNAYHKNPSYIYTLQASMLKLKISYLLLSRVYAIMLKCVS